MNTRKFTLLFTALVGLAVSAFAQTKATEATVSQLTGSATVTLPDGTTTALATGSKVPQGATITTAADGEVYLQTHANTVAILKPGTTLAVDELSVTTSGGKITQEKTTLNLKSGNMISALDPAKKNVNNYSVRTPKGVAAARGTSFTVQVNGQTFKVAINTTTGEVQVTSPTGSVVTVLSGQASVSTVNGGASTPVSELTGTDKTDAIQAMAVAVATIGVAANQGMLGADGAAQFQAAATNVITAVPEAAATVAALVTAAVPSQAAVISTVTTTVAPQQSAAVNAAVQATQAAGTPTVPTSPSSTPAQQPANTPPATTPQPIDVSTVSRSGE